MNYNAEIKKIRMKKCQIEVDWDATEPLDLQISCKVGIGEPKEENDKSIYMDMELSVEDKKEGEFYAVLGADIIFAFNELPIDSEETTQLCIPIAAKELLRKMDDILMQMGEKKLELWMKI